MDCFSLWASTANEAATNGISKSPQHNPVAWLHSLPVFLSCSTTGLPVTAVIVTSLRWFLHSQAWNNSCLGLLNLEGGGRSFTALWSDTQMASKPEMIYSLWPNYNIFKMRSAHFLLNANVKHRARMVLETNIMLNWTKQLNTGYWGKMTGEM